MSADDDDVTTRARGAGQALPSDPAELERLVEARRAHLAATLDELALRARPKALARSSAVAVRGRLRRSVTAPDGTLRVERVGAVVASVGVVLALGLWYRHQRAVAFRR